jgi:hypothetical protein
MRSDTIKQRTTPKGLKPFVMTNLKTLEGLDEVVAFIEKQACWRPDRLFQDEKSRLERRLFLEPVRDYWLARSRWNSRASWMNSIRELIAWRMMNFL